MMKKMMLFLMFLLFVATVINPVSHANATLIGNTITAEGITLTPNSATIGSGVEFTGFNDLMNFDFGANTLTITAVTDGPGVISAWSGFRNFVFSGFSEAITSFTLASNTGFAGSIVDHYSFTSTSITLDMSDGSKPGPPSSEIVFNINSAGTPVPEPGTIMLFGFGMLGLAVYGKRRMNNEA